MGKPYGVKLLLQDLSPSSVNWVPEPYTTGVVECLGTIREICGTFRHVSCSRVSVCEIPFIDLMCGKCALIPQEGDFRMRVL